MPIYEYECKGCQNRFEIRQSFNDEPHAECPLCKEPARRVFLPAPIIFKGSGFYITDHRKNTGGETSKGDTKPSKSKT